MMAKLVLKFPLATLSYFNNLNWSCVNKGFGISWKNFADKFAKINGKGNKILFTSGRSGSPQIYELDLRKLNPKAKRISFEGTYNAKASYLPNEEGIIFVHRSNDGLFHIALKYKKENFIRVLTEAKMDESPSVAPNGNMVIYGIREENLSMLAGFSLSGAKFKLPASNGEVREPAWSNFLR